MLFFVFQEDEHISNGQFAFKIGNVSTLPFVYRSYGYFMS